LSDKNRHFCAVFAFAALFTVFLVLFAPFCGCNVRCDFVALLNDFLSRFAQICALFGLILSHVVFPFVAHFLAFTASSSKERSQVDSGEHVDNVQGDGEEELEKETEDESGRVQLRNVRAVAQNVDDQRLLLAPEVSVCH